MDDLDAEDAEVDALWNELWKLEHRLNQGETLALTDDIRALLRRTAPTVAIGEDEAVTALSNTASATALLVKIRARIRDGSNRIMDALERMYDLQDAGNLDGARQQMRDVLDVEVVPHYREIAEGELEKMDDPS
jgi:DUSAM domain-containing protein